MARPRLQAPRGTFDVLPDASRERLALFNLCQSRLERLGGFGYMETPIFEDTELFARGVGEATDIVEKEMFTFEDRAGRSLTLRPEGTAGACRAYVEHGMHKRPQPVRTWYWGPFFRHEAPQAGRYRQFTQIGAEAIGSDDPSLDAELILSLAELIAEAGVRGVRLRLSSLGTAEVRRDYTEELRAHLHARRDELTPAVRSRIDANPLRAFDSADQGTRSVLAEAPRLLDRLAPADAEHFETVRGLLDDARQQYDVDATLVRGLDYYTRTVFEFTSDALGAQSGVGGGGRYDGLVEELGGPPTAAVGWAAGVERILLAAGAGEGDERREGPKVFVARRPDADLPAAFSVLHSLRERGVSAQLEQAGRSLKGQLKHAERLGADWVAVVGAEGIELTDRRAGASRAVAGTAEVLEAVRAQRDG